MSTGFNRVLIPLKLSEHRAILAVGRAGPCFNDVTVFHGRVGSPRDDGTSAIGFLSKNFNFNMSPTRALFLHWLRSFPGLLQTFFRFCRRPRSLHGLAMSSDSI